MSFRGRVNRRRVCSMYNRRGDLGTIKVTPDGAFLALCAAIAVQAVEDIQEWRSRGLLAGSKIVANLYRHDHHTRMADGYKVNASEVHQTLEWVESGEAQKFIRRLKMHYQLPEAL